MASFKLSALVTDIKGKMQGSYFRLHNNTVIACSTGSKSTKADAGRTALQKARNQVAYVSRSWANISPSEQTAWASYASTLTWFSKVGNPYTPSAYQVFNQINLSLASVNLLPKTTPSLEIPTTQLINIGIDWTDSSDIQVSYSADVTDVNLVKVYASSANSLGVKVPKSGYRIIAISPANALNGLNINNQLASYLGVIPTSGRLFFKFIVVSNLSGIEGVTRTTSVIAIP